MLLDTNIKNATKHRTALMNYKKSVPKMLLCSLFCFCTRTYANSLINSIDEVHFSIDHANTKYQFEMEYYSLHDHILIPVLYSKYLRINMGIGSCYLHVVESGPILTYSNKHPNNSSVFNYFLF